MNDLYDSWLSTMTMGEVSNYLAKIIDHEILLLDLGMVW
jgi:hypothetical protein